MLSQSIPVIDHISAKIIFDKFDFDESSINHLGENLCRDSGLNIIKKAEHYFQPIGYTVVFILAESHLAIHTWPENNLLHIDLLSCRKIDGANFDNFLKTFFKNKKIISYISGIHNI